MYGVSSKEEQKTNGLTKKRKTDKIDRNTEKEKCAFSSVILLSILSKIKGNLSVLY